MSDSAIYTVALPWLDKYADRLLVPRSSDLRALDSAVSQWEGEGALLHAQVSLPAENASCAQSLPDGLPIDLILPGPEAYPQLYEWAEFGRDRPIRITVPMRPGFSRAVRLALSLDFAVKMTGHSIPDNLASETQQVLQHFLHHPAVSQPVDFLSGLLSAFCGRETRTLWEIQEEDPALFRYIGEAGAEECAPSMDADSCAATPAELFARYQSAVETAGGECVGCEFFDVCRGFFKWPDGRRGCANERAMLKTLQIAASELRREMAASDTEPEKDAS
jgi:hypothetical protein